MNSVFSWKGTIQSVFMVLPPPGVARQGFVTSTIWQEICSPERYAKITVGCMVYMMLMILIGACVGASEAVSPCPIELASRVGQTAWVSFLAHGDSADGTAGRVLATVSVRQVCVLLERLRRQLPGCEVVVIPRTEFAIEVLRPHKGGAFQIRCRDLKLQGLNLSQINEHESFQCPPAQGMAGSLDEFVPFASLSGSSETSVFSFKPVFPPSLSLEKEHVAQGEVIAAAACISATFGWLAGASSDASAISHATVRARARQLDSGAPTTAHSVTGPAPLRKSTTPVGSTLDLRFAKRDDYAGPAEVEGQAAKRVKLAATAHSTSKWDVTFFSTDNPSEIQETVVVEAVKPHSAAVLLDLFDLMKAQANDDDFGFHHNRASILDMWKSNMVYVLALEETPDMSEEFLRYHPLLMWSNESYRTYFPVMVALEAEHDCGFLWVSQSMRGRGAARVILDLADVRQCTTSVASAVPFWNKMDIPYSAVQGRN